MVSKRNVRASIYGDYIVEQVCHIARVGGGEFSFQGFAERLGIKPTHSLRKRLVTCQSLALLTINYAKTDKGGLRYNYVIHPAPDESGIGSGIPF